MFSNLYRIVTESSCISREKSIIGMSTASAQMHLRRMLLQTKVLGHGDAHAVDIAFGGAISDPPGRVLEGIRPTLPRLRT